MLKLLFHTQLQLGFAQAAIAGLAALAVALSAGKRNIHLESETLVAMIRGIVQIVAVGSILLLLLRGPRGTSIFLLAAMIGAAGATSARRAKDLPDAFRVSLWAIALGAGSVIALRSLGIVWIPGLMAGMLLSGSRPVYAAIYQFVVLAMIFAASGLTALVSIVLIRSRIFSSAEQLMLRPR
jgi:ABC-type iron transport system FetAB permease component